MDVGMTDDADRNSVKIDTAANACSLYENEYPQANLFVKVNQIETGNISLRDNSLCHETCSAHHLASAVSIIHAAHQRWLLFWPALWKLDCFVDQSRKTCVQVLNNVEKVLSHDESFSLFFCNSFRYKEYQDTFRNKSRSSHRSRR